MPINPGPPNAPQGADPAPLGTGGAVPPAAGAPTTAAPQNAPSGTTAEAGSGEGPPPAIPPDARPASPDEIPSPDEERAARLRAAADRLRPYQWKKGESGRTGIKGPNREARVRKELRALMDQPVKEMRFAVEIAIRLGFTPEEIDSGNLMLSKLFAATGFMHAVRGKSAYFTEIVRRVDSQVSIEDPDEAYEPSQPDDERSRAVAFYRRIIASEETSVREKMEAQREMNELLGLVTSDSRSAQEKARTVLEAIKEIGEF